MRVLSCNPYTNFFYIGATWDEYYSCVERYVTDKERNDDYISFYKNEYLERDKGFYNDIRILYRCEKVYDVYFYACRDLSYVSAVYINQPYFPNYPRNPKRWRELEQVEINSLEDLKMVPMIAINKYKFKEDEEFDYCLIEALNNNVIYIKNEDEIPFHEANRERRYVCFYEKNKHKLEISVECGNIVDFGVDAVVNAANSELLPGGGVCGAIFSRAGYEELYKECRKIGGCKTGGAVITNGYNLNSKYIIHTVGPIYENDEISSILFRLAYVNTLDIADGYSLKTIALPSISTGIYGYPKEKAVKIALDTILAYDALILEKVILVCYDREMYNLYINELKERNVKIKD